MRRLRTEVDWGRKQAPEICAADAAIALAERSFIAVDQITAGEAGCRALRQIGIENDTGGRATQAMQPRMTVSTERSSGARIGSSAAAPQAEGTAQPLPAGQRAPAAEAADGSAEPEGSMEQHQAGLSSQATGSGVAWDPSLLAYECPLFARKFPNATAQQVSEVLSNCTQDLRVLPNGRADAAPCATSPRRCQRPGLWRLFFSGSGCKG